jgi:hypothetical protein
MKDKICYVINFYLGDRRKTVSNFHTDRLFFLRKQIALLNLYEHKLSKIIFNFNMREQDYSYVSQIFKITPKTIQNAEVEISFRKNYGMSYGAWSDAFDRNEDKYDYFIFNEDDYAFVENDWDSYLVNKFNSYEDCGYLCMVIREPHHWNDYKKHAGHSTGISSNKVLKDVKNKHGYLPHSKEGDYSSNEQFGQVMQTFVMLELGYNIYDVRDDYRVSFAWTEPDSECDIYRFHWWNEKDLLNPILLVENYNYSWYMMWDGENTQEHKITTIEKALDCYNNKKTYYGETL